MNAYTVALNVFQAIAAAALAWSCFCRLVRTDHDTIREVRLAIWFQAVTACLLVGAPVIPLLVPELSHAWKPWTTPRWIYLAGLASATVMQIVTARYWGDGVPTRFQKSGSTPDRGGYMAGAVILATALLAWLAVGPLPATAAQAEPETIEIVGVEAGDTVACANPTGCVVMRVEDFRRLVNAAERGMRRSTI